MADSSIDLSGEMDLKEPLIESKSQGLIPSNVNAAQAADWIRKRRENVRPWSVFLNSNKFSLPQSAAQTTKRIIRNVEHFQSNYVFIFLGLAVYSLLTSPLLLLALGVTLGAFYIIHLKNVDNRARVFGRELNLAQQYALVGLLSIPLFIFAGAGSAIFWLIGASLFFILLHASFFTIDSPDQQLEMETV